MHLPATAIEVGKMFKKPEGLRPVPTCAMQYLKSHDTWFSLDNYTSTFQKNILKVLEQSSKCKCHFFALKKQKFSNFLSHGLVPSLGSLWRHKYYIQQSFRIDTSQNKCLFSEIFPCTNKIQIMNDMEYVFESFNY